MKFKELNEILQLKLKKSCRKTKSLKGWLPSDEDYVYMRDGVVLEIFTSKLEIEFKDNEVIAVNEL